jgi:hypothetical protein
MEKYEFKDLNLVYQVKDYFQFVVLREINKIKRLDKLFL